MRPPEELWGHVGDERLLHDLGDVIDRFVDDCWPTVPVAAEFACHHRRPATVYADDILESVLERLDENYRTADPDYESSEPTPLMKQAAELFAAVVASEYESYDCEEVRRMTVDLRQWWAANRSFDEAPTWVEVAA